MNIDREFAMVSPAKSATELDPALARALGLGLNSEGVTIGASVPQTAAGPTPICGSLDRVGEALTRSTVSPRTSVTANTTSVQPPLPPPPSDNANALQAAIAALGANTTAADGSLRSTPDNHLAALLQAQLASQAGSSSSSLGNPFGMGLAGGTQQTLDLQQQLIQQQQQQAAALQQMQMMALLQQQQQQQTLIQQYQPSATTPTPAAATTAALDVPAKSKASCSPPAVQPASANTGVSTAATLTTCSSPAVRDVDLVGATASVPLGQASSSFNALAGGGLQVGGGGGGLVGFSGLGSLLFGAGGGMNPSAAEFLLAQQQQQQQQQQAMLVQFLQQQAMINALMSTLTSAPPTSAADSAVIPSSTLAASSPPRPSLSIAAGHPILPDANVGLLGVSSCPSGLALASGSSAHLLPTSMPSSLAPPIASLVVPIAAAPSSLPLTGNTIGMGANGVVPPLPSAADTEDNVAGLVPTPTSAAKANLLPNPSSSTPSQQFVVAAVATTGREKNSAKSGVSPQMIVVQAPAPTHTTTAVVLELFCSYCEHRTHTVEKCRYRLKKLEEVRIQEEKAKADAEAAEALRKQKTDSIAKAKAEAEARLKQYKANKAAASAAAAVAAAEAVAAATPAAIVSPTSAPPISGGTVAFPTSAPKISANTTPTPTPDDAAAMTAVSGTAAATSATAQPIVTSMVNGSVGSTCVTESDAARDKEADNTNDNNTTNKVRNKTKPDDAENSSNKKYSVNGKDKEEDDDDNCNTTDKSNADNTNYRNDTPEVPSDSEKAKRIPPMAHERQDVPPSSVIKHIHSPKEEVPSPVVHAAAETSVDVEKQVLSPVASNIDEEATLNKTPVSPTSPPRSPIPEVSTSVATTTVRERAVVAGEKRIRDRSRSRSRDRSRRDRRDRSRSRERDRSRGRGGRSPSPSRRGDRDRPDDLRGGRRVEKETIPSKRRQPRARSRSPRTLEREMKADREKNRGKDEVAEDHLPQRRFNKIVLDIGSCHPLCSYTSYTSSSSRTRDLRQRFDHIVRETSYTFTSHGSVSPFQGTICKEQRNELVNLMKSGRSSRNFDDNADQWMVRTVALVLLMIASAEKASEDGEARFKSYCASVRAHLENSYVNARAFPSKEPLEMLWGRIWLHSSRSLNVPVAPPAGLRYYVGSGVPGCRYGLPSSSGSGGTSKAPPSSRDNAGGSRRL